MRVCVVREYQF